ncbi:CCA tRNA nucleotidyltransferase [Pyrococcus sp. ST04]|uniref:CCA tRNA nucleotidyltransferase n=1 Tax=Pyrococcus sp. ST04 TaxID=1183377 RepID=UPI000260595B|nr:CCA tRNA nucleotidyltransferase [Pyrococcus sp. ST04]AFK21772.1 tRNA CCA-pyrophosphorylase [Pyrococcus sp. ST04]
MSVTEVIERVLVKIRPSEEEKKVVNSITRDLIELSREVIEESGLDVTPVPVGSIAKDTFLSGDHDIDLFLAFPLDLSLNELKEEGLKLAKEIGRRLERYEIGYAEHPYVRGYYKGYQVDLVPCYNVKDWREVKTAVDRSILHTKWVLENIDGKNDEVRLLKRFLKGINAYGSEIYIRGFSGYLAEILVIKFGSFLKVLEKADFMLKQKVIDPAGWLKKEPELAMKTVKREIEEDKPIVVIDPVDPRRNVAANLSWERYGLFYFRSAQFLKSPSEDFFFPKKRIGSYREELKRRGTHLVTLIFQPPNLVDDILLPQLERTAKGITRQLELEGFKVLGYDYGKNFIFIEVDRTELPRVEIKRGPLYFSTHGMRFYEKNERVWIEGKDLYSEREREDHIVDVLEKILQSGGFSAGKNVKKVVKESDILVDFVPRSLHEDAYIFLARQKFIIKCYKSNG